MDRPTPIRLYGPLIDDVKEELASVLSLGSGMVAGMPHIKNDGSYRSTIDVWANGEYTGVSQMRGSKLSIRKARGQGGPTGPLVYDYTYAFAYYLGRRAGSAMANNNEKARAIRFSKFGELSGLGEGCCCRSRGPKPTEVAKEQVYLGFLCGIGLSSDESRANDERSAHAQPNVYVIGGANRKNQVILFVDNSCVVEENKRSAITRMAIEYAKSLEHS